MVLSVLLYFLLLRRSRTFSVLVILIFSPTFPFVIWNKQDVKCQGCSNMWVIWFWFLFNGRKLCSGKSQSWFVSIIKLNCRTTVFSHSQTVVVCGNCQTVLCQPTGGRATLTEGSSFRKRGDWAYFFSSSSSSSPIVLGIFFWDCFSVIFFSNFGSNY